MNEPSLDFDPINVNIFYIIVSLIFHKPFWCDSYINLNE